MTCLKPLFVLLLGLPLVMPIPAKADSAFEALIAGTGDPVAFQSKLAGAVQKHPAVLEAIAQQREAGSRTSEIKAGLLPTVNFNLATDNSLSRRFTDANGNRIESLRPKNRVDAVLSGQQLITDFGATRHRIKGSRLRERAAQTEVSVVAAEITLEAVSAHSRLVELQTLTKLGDVFLVRHRQILADTKLRFDQGYGPGGDVARVEAYLARAEGQIAGISRDLASARARYRSAFDADAEANLQRVQAPRSSAISKEEAEAIAEKMNLGVQRANAVSLGAGEDYAAAKSDRLPRLSLALDATKYNVFDGSSDYDVRTRVVGSYPLFNGGLSSARSAQALQRAQAADQAEARARTEAARDVSIAFEDLKALEAQVATLKRAYDANIKARDFFVEQFKVARGSLLDLLQAEQDTFEATSQYIAGLTAQDVARYRLLQQTGELLPAIGVKFSFHTAQDLFGAPSSNTDDLFGAQ
jgi:outer membrane protein, adhesin transport system